MSDPEFWDGTDWLKEIDETLALASQVRTYREGILGALDYCDKVVPKLRSIRSFVVSRGMPTPDQQRLILWKHQALRNWMSGRKE